MSSGGGMRLVVGGRAAVFALSLLCAGAAVSSTRSAAAAGTEAALLAHGTADGHWLARVYKDEARPETYLTDIYARSAGDANWQQVARVEGRTVQLAHRGGQLALLLDRGGWLLVSDETVVTGRAPPPGARLLALAPWGDTLAALARVSEARAGPVRPASTAPATSPPAPERLALLTLTPQGWVDAGGFDLPGALPDTSADASLVVVEGTPTVAVREGPNAVRVLRSGAAAGGGTVVKTARPVAAFKLLGGPVPVLWTVEEQGAPRLHWLTSGTVRTVEVDLSPAGNAGGAATATASAAVPAGRPPAAATYAIDRVRVLYGGGLVLSERVYDALAGTPTGDATRVILPRTPVAPQFWEWLQSLLPVLLLFTIISSLRRRREIQETMQSADRLPLAPFGRRLLAGLIDALPVLAATVVVGVWEQRAADTGGAWLAPRSQVVFAAGVLLYLLHTTASEAAFGRTVGKACCGLRVVGLDGERPSAGAMVTRNLLRLIDLSMMFFPLVLVLYSPLRQRAGDVAAGTLVVLNKRGSEPVADDEVPAHGSAGEKAAEPAEVAD